MGLLPDDGEGQQSKEDTPDQRRVHAELLKDLLVTINFEYKKRFGTPPPAVSRPAHVAGAARLRREERDVEMIAV